DPVAAVLFPGHWSLFLGWSCANVNRSHHRDPGTRGDLGFSAVSGDKNAAQPEAEPSSTHHTHPCFPASQGSAGGGRGVGKKAVGGTSQTSRSDRSTASRR